MVFCASFTYNEKKKKFNKIIKLKRLYEDSIQISVYTNTIKPAVNKLYVYKNQIATNLKMVLRTHGKVADDNKPTSTRDRVFFIFFFAVENF